MVARQTSITEIWRLRVGISLPVITPSTKSDEARQVRVPREVVIYNHYNHVQSNGYQISFFLFWRV